MPRRRMSNQADISATEGTSTIPLPSPVRRRAPEAATTPSESPVAAIPSAATTEPTPTTMRGPNLEARMPPTAAISTYPPRFQEASEPAAALLMPRSSCMAGRMAL